MTASKEKSHPSIAAEEAGPDSCLPGGGSCVLWPSLLVARRCPKRNTELPSKVSQNSGLSGSNRPVCCIVAGARHRRGGIYLPMFDAVFSWGEICSSLNLMDHRVLRGAHYWWIFRTIHDVDIALGGKQNVSTIPVLQAASLISRRPPDDHEAVAILSRVLPGVGGRIHKLVRRFARALYRWRKHRRMVKNGNA